ncbi:MAG: phenylalanine--tRNA ligase subunit beta [SAR202 cluster bacterium]|nr:phenylalanine--tRNA ligase subunit beta [SAR202 cluster bacterium]
MDVPLSWLRQYVPVDILPIDLAHHITMAGTEVVGIRHTGEDWDRTKIVVGHVQKVDPHPNADRLSLPTVDLGEGETVTVVCGAPNIAVGQKIAFAREGALLFSPRSDKKEPLKATTIRGTLSTGMICSEIELGLSENHEGVLVLEDDAPTGVPLVDYLGDAVFELELTPNRPDCSSILGVAHEVAAVTGEFVTEPDLSYEETGESIKERITVDIVDSSLCGRYAASLVTGIDVKPSPKWLQKILVKAGQRPINNVVDVTNFVMLEYGQPLHAFDLSKIKDETIVVRPARSGEHLTTLDGTSRTLHPPMLTIADSENAIALAGVMGGIETEVRKETTDVLLEAANFDPINTRRTAASLRLKTEASYRFERGIRPDLVTRALRRATQLILEVAGGKVAKGIIDQYPCRQDPIILGITSSRIKQVIGTAFDRNEVLTVLNSLGFDQVVDESSEDSLAVRVPYWRSDIAIEEDLIEEVARIVGYDVIPTVPMSTPIPHRTVQPMIEFKEKVRDLLVGVGLQETISYPLEDALTLDSVQHKQNKMKRIKIANPLNAGVSYLRDTLRGSVLKTLKSNRRISQRESIRIFEIGRIYLSKGDEKGVVLPEEKEMLVGVLSGPQSEQSWHARTREMNFFDAKGVLETVFGALGIVAEYEELEDPSLHPGKAAEVFVGGQSVGIVGEIHPLVLNHFGLDDGSVAMFDVDLKELQTSISKSTKTYAGIIRFPESERDMALIVESLVPSSKIQKIIMRHKLVKSTSPVDVYTGEGVPKGKKSVAYRIVFQSTRSTLTAELLNRAEGDILRQLQSEVGAELRI